MSRGWNLASKKKAGCRRRKTECEDGTRQIVRQSWDRILRKIGDERKKGEREKQICSKKLVRARGSSREKYRERKDRARGRSSGSSGARDSGGGSRLRIRGCFQRSTQCSLVSRAGRTGENVRAGWQKEGTFLIPSANSYPRGPRRSFPPKEKLATKSRSALCIIPSFLFFRLFVSRTSVKSGRGTREWNDSRLMHRDLRPGGRSRANTCADNVILEVFLDVVG